MRLPLMAATDIWPGFDFETLDRHKRVPTRLAIERNGPGIVEQGAVPESEPRLEPQRAGGSGETLSSPVARFTSKRNWSSWIMTGADPAIVPE